MSVNLKVKLDSRFVVSASNIEIYFSHFGGYFEEKIRRKKLTTLFKENRSRLANHDHVKISLLPVP